VYFYTVFLFVRDILTKSAKEEKDAKEKAEVVVRRLYLKFHGKTADKNPFFSFCELFFLCVLCVKSFFRNNYSECCVKGSSCWGSIAFLESRRLIMAELSRRLETDWF